MNVSISDPLELLVYQNGLVQTPTTDDAARGQNDLDSRQLSVVIGTPIPIVFCRRRSNIGGVLVSPQATEGRYSNDSTSNELTVKLILVLSDGEVGTLSINDVFQRACRVGSWNQSYNRRPSNWLPGNFTTVVSGKQAWNCPSYCGTSGRYENLTTLNYENSHDDSDSTWDKQVHIFVREGLKVSRLVDGVTGSSDNFVDLAKYLLTESSLLPTSLLDNTLMTAAAKFVDSNGLFFNGVLKESVNLEDWISEVGGNFLLRMSEKGGKKFLKPKLPYNSDGTINTGKVTESFAFTEDHVLENGFDISYIPLSERKDICALMLWRQQPDADLGLIRTTECRFTGLASNGPYEQHDLSLYCSSELHAARVGMFIVARKKYITHSLRIKIRPSVFNSTLAIGDIVRVRLRRETNETTELSFHDFLYEVERIQKALTGVLTLDLLHFPLDDEGKSLVALAVEATTGKGVLLSTGKATGFSCDTNSGTTDLTDTGFDYDDYKDSSDWDILSLDETGFNSSISNGFDPDFDQAGGFPSSHPSFGSLDLRDLGGYPPDHPVSNPTDPLEGISGSLTDDRTDKSIPLKRGDTLTTNTGCAGGKVYWYRRDKSTGEKTLISTETGDGTSDNFSYSLTTSDIDYVIEAHKECPDPSSPTGFGNLEKVGETDLVEPNVGDYTHARFKGTTTIAGGTTTTSSVTGDWIAVSSSDTLSLGPVYGHIICTAQAPGSLSGWEFPSISYAPWRASVQAKQFVFVCSGGSMGLGGVFKNSYSCNIGNNPLLSPTCIQASDDLWNDNQPVTWTISGSWEFSTNGSSVAFTWAGRASG